MADEDYYKLAAKQHKLKQEELRHEAAKTQARYKYKESELKYLSESERNKMRYETNLEFLKRKNPKLEEKASYISARSSQWNAGVNVSTEARQQVRFVWPIVVALFMIFFTIGPAFSMITYLFYAVKWYVWAILIFVLLLIWRNK